MSHYQSSAADLSSLSPTGLVALIVMIIAAWWAVYEVAAFIYRRSQRKQTSGEQQ